MLEFKYKSAPKEIIDKNKKVCATSLNLIKIIVAIIKNIDTPNTWIKLIWLERNLPKNIPIMKNAAITAMGLYASDIYSICYQNKSID